MPGLISTRSQTRCLIFLPGCSSIRSAACETRHSRITAVGWEVRLSGDLLAVNNERGCTAQCFKWYRNCIEIGTVLLLSINSCFIKCYLSEVFNEQQHILQKM